MINDWKLFALFSAIFAALTAIFGKIGVSEINSNLATFIRTIVILMVSALFISFNKEWVLPSELSKKSLLFLILSGFATGSSWLCYYRALQLGPASKVAPVDKLSVVFVILLAALFLNEPLKIKTIVGGILVCAGTVILAI
ncbi:MAG: EamA family transporter [Bdellovibrionales bacterium]|nr:EamA family transporter [Bdellovibrionales bacterium]